jgi:hypothetical protein
MQNMNPGPRLNRWEPITANGYQVTCQSYLEASELILLVGGALHSRPSAAMDDDAYEKWLLKHWFVIEAWTPSYPFDERGVNKREMEMSFGLFIRGWFPDAEDLPIGARTGIMDMAEKILRSRWADR